MSMIHRLFQCGVVLTLLAAPTQWAVEIRPKVFFSPADLLLAITACLWFAENLFTRQWKRLFVLPPWSHLLFVGIAALSVTVANDKMLACKELIQLVAYFLVGAWVFDAFLREGGRASRVWTFVALLAGFLANVAVAFFQCRAVSDVDILKVAGFFGTRNVLGGYLAMLTPIVVALIFASRSWMNRIALGLVVLLSFSVILSGAAWGALILALLAMAAVAGWKRFLPLMLILAFFQVWILQKLPRVNDLAHNASVALYDENGQVERRYPDWQAALNLSFTNPDLGVGLGNYQREIGQYYDQIPRRTGPSEPDTQNLYLVILATCGVGGLFAYLGLLFSGIGAAVRSVFRQIPVSPRLAWLAGGVAAGLFAFAVTCVWHPLLVRGMGIPFLMMLMLARRLGDPWPTEVAEACDENKMEEIKE